MYSVDSGASGGDGVLLLPDAIRGDAASGSPMEPRKDSRLFGDLDVAPSAVGEIEERDGEQRKMGRAELRAGLR